jgi:hypothetical protein
MGASICWAAAEADTQFTIFDLSAPEKQLLIFQHLGLWARKARPSPPDVHIDHVYFEKSRKDSQVPACEDYLYSDPDYPVEASVYEQVDPLKKNGHEIQWRRLSNFDQNRYKIQ